MTRRAAVLGLAWLFAGNTAAVAGDGWSGFPIIVWQDQSPTRAAGLQRLGITAGRIFGTRGELSQAEAEARMAPLLAAGMAFYVENIATDFYAAYHRWTPEHPPGWAFDQIRAQARADPADPRPTLRVPSLSDPAALARITARLAQHVRRYGPARPLYYSLGDETGIADLAAAWDFDFSAVSLAALRAWLADRYGSLAALNRQWGRDFAAWQAVRPDTTDQAPARADDNFSAWSDFKDGMDAAFAGAVRAGTEAVHAADEQARAGLEGAQVPGWGGYDYSRLAAAVDVMELYDSGCNVEIATGLNPDLAVLTTIAAGAALPELHGKIWRAVLQGSRGLILWDEAGALVDDAGAATPLGRDLGGLFHELAQAAVAAGPPMFGPVLDPVAILYSPASFRLRWLLDRRDDQRRSGADWRRSAEAETNDAGLRAPMQQAASLLRHLGVQPHWLSPALLAGGALRDGIKLLLLPDIQALGPAEAAAIRDFAARGGVVLADAAPGAFDAHGRRLERPGLSDLVASGALRLAPQWADLAQRLQEAGVRPAVTLLAADGAPAGDVGIWLRGHVGRQTLVGLLRDPGGGADPLPVTLVLPRPQWITDLRRRSAPVRTDRLALTLRDGEAVLLGVSDPAVP